MTNSDHTTNGRGRFSRAWRSLFGRAPERDLEAAAYRRLALQLHYDLPRGGTRSALLMSPSACPLSAPGALGLASSLVQELGQSVLLMDACPSRPEVTSLLGSADNPGWADLLESNDGSRTLDSVVLPTSTEHLWFLPAGKHRSGSPSASVLETHLSAAHQQYDFVLISGGSVLDDASGLALLPHVGCVLLLVTEDETRIDDLRDAQHALMLCKARNVRIVLTAPTREKASFPAYPQVKPRVHPQAVGKLVAE